MYKKVSVRVQDRAMHTHVELDDAALADLMRLGDFPSKKVAINTAIAEYVRLLRRRQLLSLRGKIRWEGNLRQLRAARKHRRRP